MKMRGTENVPGQSVVDLKGKLHAFLTADRSHPSYLQIIELLEKLEVEMTFLGYTPKTEFVLHNIEEEVKVRVCNHRERLTIIFPLEFRAWNKIDYHKEPQGLRGLP